MTRMAVELSDEEVARLNSVGIEHTLVSGSNFDGGLLSTVLISLTSATTIKAIMPLLLEIVKGRRSGAIKINGMELKNVSEAAILKAIETTSTRAQ